MGSDVCTLCANDEKSNFEYLLKKDGSVSTHHQNIRFLAIAIFQVFKCICPQTVKEIFQFRDEMPYQLRKQTDFQIPSVHSVVKGTEIIKFLGPKI